MARIRISVTQVRVQHRVKTKLHDGVKLCPNFYDFILQEISEKRLKTETFSMQTFFCMKRLNAFPAI